MSESHQSARMDYHQTLKNQESYKSSGNFESILASNLAQCSSSKQKNTSYDNKVRRKSQFLPADRWNRLNNLSNHALDIPGSQNNQWCRLVTHFRPRHYFCPTQSLKSFAKIFARRAIPLLKTPGAYSD